jgi:hypothetical protein
MRAALDELCPGAVDRQCDAHRSKPHDWSASGLPSWHLRSPNRHGPGLRAPGNPSSSDTRSFKERNILVPALDGTLPIDIQGLSLSSIGLLGLPTVARGGVHVVVAGGFEAAVKDADEPVWDGGRDCVPLGAAFSGGARHRVPLRAARDRNDPR